MKAFIRLYKAEFYKQRKGIFYPLHFAAPILLSVVFFLFFLGRRNSITAIGVESYFFQVIGLVLPFLISILCGMVSKNELEAGGGSNLLKLPKRGLGLLAQLSMMLTLCAGSLGGSIVGFYAVLKLLGLAFPPLLGLFSIIGFLWMSTIFLYILHLFIGYAFGVGVDCIIGFFGIIVSAVAMTGLGDHIWYFLPHSWSLRIVRTQLLGSLGQLGTQVGKQELTMAVGVIIVCSLVGFFLYLLWINHWEGRISEE